MENLIALPNQLEKPVKTLFTDYIKEIRAYVEHIPTLTVSPNRFEKIKKAIKEIESRYPDQRYKVHFVEINTESEVNVSLTKLPKIKRISSEKRIKEFSESLLSEMPLMKDLLSEPTSYPYYEEATERRIYITYNDEETNKAIRQQLNFGIGVIILAKNHNFTLKKGTHKKVNRLTEQKNTFKFAGNTYVVLPPEIVAIHRMLNY